MITYLFLIVTLSLVVGIALGSCGIRLLSVKEGTAYFTGMAVGIIYALLAYIYLVK